MKLIFNNKFFFPRVYFKTVSLHNNINGGLALSDQYNTTATSILEPIAVKPTKVDIHAIIKDNMEYDKEGRCTNAFKILSSTKILILAYNSIKSEPGNMTEGIEPTTLDGISMK